MNTYEIQAFVEKRAVALEKLRAGKAHALPRVEASASSADFYLYDQIGGWDGIFAKDVVRALNGVSGDLTVHINSGGGDIFEGVAIYNAFKNYKGTVTTRVEGVAASAASFIAMAADKVVIEANASMMVHDGWGLAVGNAADMREMADMLDLVSDQIAEMYALKTGGKARDWRKTMAKDTWYNATQAQAAGLADEIAGENSAAAQLDLAVFSYQTNPAEREPAEVTNSVPSPRTDDVAGIFAAFKEAIK